MNLHGGGRLAHRWAAVALATLAALTAPVMRARADDSQAPDAPQQVSAPAPDSPWPALLSAQYTFVLQNQSSLHSPYAGIHSLYADGDTQPTHTIGFYGGWAPTGWLQFYLDTEKFMGAGVSGATGLGGLTNGDVVREGSAGLEKAFYIARVVVRTMIPLGPQVAHVDRAQDQVAGMEAVRRIEFKAGRLAVTDDFDKNRYAGATRTQFMNWSLWANTAWDYAANTRGYTDGVIAAFVSPAWALRYGLYSMPTMANGQTLETLNRAREQDLELTLSPRPDAFILRVLAYDNTARMGIYEAALARSALTGMPPDIVADDQDGRHKYGFGLNAEFPLADEGETGLFMRAGWNDGSTETFVFTEVDRQVNGGIQVSGVHWGRSADRFGAAVVVEGLSAAHRDYLAAGGNGFILGDGRLNYAHEQILETYYRFQVFDSIAKLPIRLQLSPDFQYARNPGYNEDRGPVAFYGIRLHLEY